ncbi:MAG: lipid-A-disaccharide synthase [Lysobacterales bacterium]
MTTIALCAGEASGDQLGAALIEALRARRPDLRFVGIGGPAMRAAGLECWYEASELAVMGLVEVLRHLPRLLRLRRAFLRRLAEAAPAIYIGIDAPDFNLGIERRLKAQGTRTVHYVSPSIWAWRQQRARSIGACADRVLCLFPFEPALYQRYGVDARFVGHPFADELPLQPDRAAALASLGFSADTQILAVLPGSRGGEIRRLAEDFLDTARAFLAHHPDWRVLIPAARPALAAELSARLRPADADAIRVIDGQMRTLLSACQLALVASGTATLEAALCQRPMVVAYRIAPLTYWIVRTFGLLKVRNYSLPNVLAERDLVPEISQDAVRPPQLLAALERWLADPAAVDAYVAECRAIHQRLRLQASARAAEAALECLS